MAKEYDTFETEEEPAPQPAPEPQEEPDAEPEGPDGLSDEEFAALRAQVRKMYDPEPEETR